MLHWAAIALQGKGGSKQVFVEVCCLCRCKLVGRLPQARQMEHWVQHTRALSASSARALHRACLYPQRRKLERQPTN